MLKRLMFSLYLGALAAPAWSQTAETAPAAPVAEAAEAVPEQILVTGQRPGPGLWKISKDDHVLWVFGSYSPLPKNMEWRSRQVESILAGSQEYLKQPMAGAHVGFFRSLTLLPFVVGLKDNPDGAKLKDVLPADVYARWQRLKDKYIGKDNGIESERPIFVADELYSKGLAHAGLSSGGEVYAAIDKIVKKNNIKSTSPGVELEIDSPVKALRDFKKSTMDDVACFSTTLERLETDLDAMRVRANAWAVGDIEAIQKLSYADRESACKAALTNSDFLKSQPGFKDMDARLREVWVTAAEKSLAANASTFAVLRLKDILDPQGYIAALQAKGYKVEAPQ
ncbi:TraB/GumN family protein [Duganella sp. Dugasp56]|jgi:hypothetical protein|uniref:TraB/GumN family protein n=1 Tax=Duganella sp. Dugasp56 TaxID=3243046 RepID=UPI0039AF98A6